MSLDVKQSRQYKQRFEIAGKHSCDSHSLNRALQSFTKHNETKKFIDIIQNSLCEYSDIYQTYNVTFTIRSRYSETTYRGIDDFQKILIKTFNALRKIYFGNVKKHESLDFIRLGAFGSGREETCGDHYHFLISMPAMLLSKLELLFKESLKKVHPDSTWEGFVHIQNYEGNVNSLINYASRYFSNKGNNNAIFDAIDWEVSCPSFAINKNHDNTHSLHEANLKFYQNKNQNVDPGQIIKSKNENNSRFKDCPKSDKSLRDNHYRSRF